VDGKSACTFPYSSTSGYCLVNVAVPLGNLAESPQFDVTCHGPRL